MELSLCMIVKNEEESLPRCLKSVIGAVDEINIVDTGSEDRTKDVARQFTDRVFDFSWQEDFAAARNASFSHATRPYILWLDADDVMASSEREKLIALKARLNGQIDAVMMPYHCGCDEQGIPALSFDRERIVRREAGFVFSGVVHEAMAVGGRVIHEDIIVRHMGGKKEKRSGRNLSIYEHWLARGRKMTPRDQYYYARELMDCGQTARAEQAFGIFLTQEGWIENRLDAHVQRGRCLMQLGKIEQARQEFLCAMRYGEPRAEALCAMGESFMAKEDYAAAAFWYRAAMHAGIPHHSGAFIRQEAYDYIPAIQLCVCYDRMGRWLEASRMNERALLAKPGDGVALANRAYFEKRLAPQMPAVGEGEALKEKEELN